MKKALSSCSLILSLILLLSISIIEPFSVYADINGFDYTNYYELEYIESTGTQYIDTGLDINGVYRTDFYVTPTVSGYDNDAVYALYSSNFIQEIFLSNQNKFCEYNNSSGSVKSVNTSISVNSKYSLAYIQSIYGGSLYVGNNSSNNSYSSASARLYLFRYFNGNNYTYGKFKLYDFLVTINNNIVRNLIPAERKSDNAIGMYDAANGVFYPNNGIGSFTAGPRLSVTQYTISTGVSPNGAGSVSGGGTYDSGDTVTLTATASNGYVFDHWSDGSTSNPLTTTATSNITYTAYFVENVSPPVNQYVISTDVSPNGSGTVTGGGTYASGSTITLTATANNGYQFDSWSDGNTTNPRSVTVSSSATYTAIFTAVTPSPTQYTVTTSVNPSGSGSVTGGGTYNSGSNVTLTAIPNTGYVFSTWSDGISSNPRTFTITSNISLTATFIQDTNNQKIIGSNISIFDYEIFANSVNNGSSGVPQIQGYTFPTTSPANRDNYFLYFTDIYFSSAERYLFQVDTILNDDYIGYVNVSATNLSSFSTRNVFVNGNHFTFTFLMSGDYGSSVNFTMDTSHLILNKSVQSLIQEGTPESSTSEDALDDGLSDANTSFDEAISIENDFTSDMNDALDDIDTSFSPSSMGSKFQSSAIWVSQQFNRITNDTPFGSLIGFSLVLGLALLIIGRVL